MPAYLTPGMVAELRRFHEAALAHTYTRVPVVPAGGNETQEAWGETPVKDGDPVPGNPCMLTFAEAVIGSERGTTTQKRPLLWVGVSDPLALGDRVEDVRDVDGQQLLAQAVVVRWEAGADWSGRLTNVAELAVTEAVTQPAGLPTMGPLNPHGGA